jgi:hypothetical protein
MSEPTDTPAVPKVEFRAPSGRLYKHQENWEGDLKVPVDTGAGQGAEIVYESIPMGDLDAIQSEALRWQLIDEIKDMSDQDVFRLVGIIAAFEI